MNVVPRARARASRAVQFQFQIRTMTTHFNAIRASHRRHPSTRRRPISAERRRCGRSIVPRRASKARTDARDSFARRLDSIRSIDRSIDRSHRIASIDRRRRCETVVSGVGGDVGDHGYVHRERERTADDAGGAVADAVDVGGVDHGGAPGRERGEVSVSGGVFGGLHGEIALVV
tara:strand:- start:4523 stop:5047 length:525 start_codon:yes stop_codon:yes gene_type:complete